MIKHSIKQRPFARFGLEELLNYAKDKVKYYLDDSKETTKNIEEILPKYQEATDIDNEFVDDRRAQDEAYRIPYIPEKSVTVDGYTFSTNMLDSIQKHANKYGIPMREALKPFVRETKMGHFEPYTSLEYFGNRPSNFVENGGATPTELGNAHGYFISPIRGEMNYIANISSGPLVYGSPYTHWGRSSYYVNDDLKSGTSIKNAIGDDPFDGSTYENKVKINDKITNSRIKYLENKGKKELKLDPYKWMFDRVRNNTYKSLKDKKANEEWNRLATQDVNTLMNSKVYKTWESKKKRNGGRISLETM